jgi:ABC-type enterochelin transport system substrate-binding protein
MPQSVYEKRDQAARLQQERANRTDQEQLKRLDQLFGSGQGAKRERARLLERIANAGTKKHKQKEDVVVIQQSPEEIKALREARKAEKKAAKRAAKED